MPPRCGLPLPSFPGSTSTEGPGRLLLVAAVFGIVNSTLRPLLTILTCPLIVVTLGLFTLVINALMLLVTGWLSESWDLGFTVSGFWAAFLGGLVVGLVSMVLSLVMADEGAASQESRVTECDRPGRL